MHLKTLIGTVAGAFAVGWASGRTGTRVTDLLDLFIEEPEVARYVTIDESAGGFQIPDPAASLPVNDRHITGIHAPGLIRGSRPVILFRTRHTGRPSFSLRLNTTQLIQQTLPDGGGLHSWHEIVPADALRPEHNELVFFVSGTGNVSFSDVVILYKSNKLTVRKPAVLDPTPG